MTNQERQSESIDDNVIPMPGAEIDPDLMTAMTDSETQARIHSIADFASTLLNETGKYKSTDEINELFAEKFNSTGSFEQQYAIAELNGILAQNGITPLESLEGLVGLRKLYANIYEDNTILPAKMQAKVKRIDLKLARIEAGWNNFIATAEVTSERDLIQARHDRDIALLKREIGEISGRRESQKERVEEELDSPRAETARAFENTKALKSNADYSDAQVQEEIRTIKVPIKIQQAKTEVLSDSIETKVQRGKLENRERVTPLVLRNDYWQKTLKELGELRKTFADAFLAPTKRFLKWALKYVVIILVIGIVFSYFVENAHIAMYPFLEPFNGLRHAMLDPIWKSMVQAWPNLAPSTPPVPKKVK